MAVPPSNVTTISLNAGDELTITVESMECGGDPETVNIYGVITAQAIFSGKCPQIGPTDLIGKTVTLGPATSAGTVYFTATHQTYGEGPPAPVTGTFPDYTVYTDDGCCGTTPTPDYNDVILKVHVARDRTLSCTPTDSITRGQIVTCRLTAANANVSGWVFTGKNYTGETDITIPRGSFVTDFEWSGPAITSGTVKVNFIISGNPDSATASFKVKPRPWTWTNTDKWSYRRGNGIPDCFPNAKYDTRGGTGAWSARLGVCDGHPVSPDPSEASAYTFEQVPAGPNEGVTYVTGVNYRLDTESNIVKAILPGYPGYTLGKTDLKACQTAGLTVANLYDYNIRCRNVNLLNGNIEAGLWRHEGYGTNTDPLTLNGHQARLEYYASLPEDGDLYRILERVFTVGPSIEIYLNLESVTVNNHLFNKYVDELSIARTNYCGPIWKWDPTKSLYVLIKKECY